MKSTVPAVWVSGPMKDHVDNWKDFTKLFSEAVEIKQQVSGDDNQLGVFVTVERFFRNENVDEIEKNLATLTKDNWQWLVVTSVVSSLSHHIQISCMYGFCARHTKFENKKEIEELRSKESLRCVWMDINYEIEFMQPNTHFYYLNPNLFKNQEAKSILVGTDTGDESKNKIALMEWNKMNRLDYQSIHGLSADIWIHTTTNADLMHASSYEGHKDIVKNGGLAITAHMSNSIPTVTVHRFCKLGKLELRYQPEFPSREGNILFYFHPFRLHDLTVCSY